MRASQIFSLVLLASTFLAGCVTVTVPEPMPYNRRDKATFPKSWQGVWHAADNDGSTDVLLVTAQYLSVDDEKYILGSENRLRKFAGYYILSSKEESTGRWILYLAKRNMDVLSVYQFDGEDELKAKIWAEVLGDDIDVVKKDSEGGKISGYRLNPENNATFRKLIAEGGLSLVGEFVR